MCSLTGDIITLFTHPFNNYPSQPKSMRPFSGFLAIGIFAIHKTWTSLAFWWRIDDKTGTLAYQFGVLFGWFKRNFSLKTPTVVEKFHPKSWKVHIPGDFCSKSRKNRKIRKVEKFTFQEISARKVEKFEKSKSSKNSKNSKSRKVHIPGDFGSKSRKNRKNRKIEKSNFCSKSSKNSKNSKSRKVENFLTFWLFAKSFAIFALCDYRREERLAFHPHGTNMDKAFLRPRQKLMNTSELAEYFKGWTEKSLGFAERLLIPKMGVS